MKASNSTRSRALDIGATGLLLLAIASVANAQTGSARAAYVSTAAGSTSIASAAVPSGGGMATDDAFDTDVAGLVSARAATALSTGMASAEQAGVQSISSASEVTILGGLVRAARVIAIASAGQGFAEAVGSSISGLEVNGVSYDGDAFAPNTRINLPGVGYAIFNEQVVGTSSVTVNMIHVTLTNLFGVPTGEIIVGSATSNAGS